MSTCLRGLAALRASALGAIPCMHPAGRSHGLCIPMPYARSAIATLAPLARFQSRERSIRKLSMFLTIEAIYPNGVSIPRTVYKEAILQSPGRSRDSTESPFQSRERSIRKLSNNGRNLRFHATSFQSRERSVRKLSPFRS